MEAGDESFFSLFIKKHGGINVKEKLFVCLSCGTFEKELVASTFYVVVRTLNVDGSVEEEIINTRTEDFACPQCGSRNIVPVEIDWDAMTLTPLSPVPAEHVEDLLDIAEVIGLTLTTGGLADADI